MGLESLMTQKTEEFHIKSKCNVNNQMFLEKYKGHGNLVKRASYIQEDHIRNKAYNVFPMGTHAMTKIEKNPKSLGNDMNDDIFAQDILSKYYKRPKTAKRDPGAGINIHRKFTVKDLFV